MALTENDRRIVKAVTELRKRGKALPPQAIDRVTSILQREAAATPEKAPGVRDYLAVPFQAGERMGVLAARGTTRGPETAQNLPERVGGMVGKAVPGFLAGMALPAAATASIPAMAASGAALAGAERFASDPSAGPKEVATSAAMGGAIPFGVAGGARLASNVGRSALAQQGLGIAREIIDKFVENPAIGRSITGEGLPQALETLTGTVRAARQEAGERLGALYRKFGVKGDKEVAENVIRGVSERLEPDQLLGNLDTVKSLFLQGELSDDLLPEVVMLKKAFQREAKFPKNQLGLASDPAENAVFTSGAADLDNILKTRASQNPELANVMGAVENFAEVADAYDDVLSQLGSKTGALGAVEKLAKKGEDIYSPVRAGIQRAEEETGRQALNPAISELTAERVGAAKGTPGILGAIADTMGPENVVKLVRMLQRGLVPGAEALSKPGVLSSVLNSLATQRRGEQ